MQNFFLKYFSPFLISLFFCPNTIAYGQCNTQAVFERISVEHGLSQGTVNAFCQDSHGFLWVATNSGLNRYDGVNFKHFITSTTDTSSVSSDIITAIFEDSKQRLWIGTKDAGLNLYNRKTETFTRITINPEAINSAAQNQVVSIREDMQGNLWIVFVGGINKFVTDRDEFVTYINTDNNPNVLPSNLILDIEITRKGDIFISTGKGIACYNAKEDSFEPLTITLQPHNVNLNSLLVNSIAIDLNDDIWFGLSGYGLYKYSPESGKIEWYADTLQSTDIYELHKAANGDIWIGTLNGLYRYDWQVREFSAFKNDPFNTSTISNNAINSIYEDKQGVIWVGVIGLGINKYNPRKSSFCEVKNLSRKLADFPTLTAKSFYEVDNDIWIGTFGEGVIRVSYSNSEILQLKHIVGDSTSLPDGYVYQITKTPDGIMWFATHGGISSYNPKDQTFKNFRGNPKNPKSLPFNFISGVFVDSKGDLWYRTFMDYFGKLDPHEDSFQNYSIVELDTAVNKDISSITDFYEDSNGVFWLGTNKPH
ncbi:MAG: two-component regulator propeller domain-containing protein [Tenuifilaceae bacterium]|nr:two-component regulator propeller domain-containing protein [Tenuifilaceae bacterium]